MIHVVTGPPAAGKTTYIQNTAHTQDIIIDLDRITTALSGPNTAHHAYTPEQRKTGLEARSAALTWASRNHHRHTYDLWIIHALPSGPDLRRYQRRGWDVITIDPGRETVEARAATERPPEVGELIARWYDQHPQQ